MHHACVGEVEATKVSILQYPGDPTTVAETMKRPDAQQWKDAMKAEWQVLMENGTFHPATENSNPGNKEPISSKWVFKMKTSADGHCKYKARLVCRGFTQVEGVEYDEVYAPVSKLATFRYLLSLSAQRGYEMRHLDVVTACLNSLIDKDDIWMMLPAGIGNMDLALKGTSLRLRKALYGFKQVPRLWYSEINAVLLSLGFTPSPFDPNLYQKEDLFLLLYIDDMLIANGKSTSKERHSKNHQSQYDVIARAL